MFDPSKLGRAMSIETDPGFWKQVSGWAWAILALPMAALWKKADGAAPRTALEKHMDDTKRDLHGIIDTIRADSKEARETMKLLFANAESDRMQNHAKFSELLQKVHDTHEKIHRTQLDLLIEIGKLK